MRAAGGPAPGSGGIAAASRRAARAVVRAAARSRAAITFVIAASIALGCGGVRVGAPPRLGASARRQPVEVGRALWPAAVARAPAEPGVVLLYAPRPRAQARRAVVGFFDAVRHESVRELEAWLAEDATVSQAAGTTPESIAKVWGARFKQLDYRVSAARQPYRPGAIGLFTRDELRELGRNAALSPDPDELLAVVETRDRQRASGPRHFGGRLEFLLGPTSDGYRIRRMFEDFQLP